MVYFVVGPSGVGKTCFSKTINEQYGIPVYDTGPILRNIYSKLKIEESFSEWVSKNEKKYGDNFAISLICEDIKEQINPKALTIIIGNRCIEGITYIINCFNLTDYRIIYLDASFDCLKTNYETREKKRLTDEEFQDRIDGGNKMGLLFLKKIILENSNNNCYYYFKKENEDLNYVDIFNEISKNKNYTKIKK